MNYTTNLRLKKPSSSDKYSVNDFNENVDKIDSEITSLKSKESTDAQNIQALQQRVGNIVAQSGSTAGNTELQDIRLGADGKTYSSAGEAVRKQIEPLTALINALGIYVDEDGNICQREE